MKSKIPKLSIGMPVYNGGRFLRESIDSILCQTFHDFEFIISDNCSNDDTEEVCRYYSEKDSRINYIRNKINVGVANNFNKVFALARGEYFKWVAHDDIHADKYIERCVEILDRDPTVILCYTKSKIIDEEGNLLKYYNDNLNLQQNRPHERLGYLLKHLNLVNALYGVIRTNYLKKTRLIGSYISSDYITLLELCLMGKFLEVPEYLFSRRDQLKNVRKLSFYDQALLIDPSNTSTFRHPHIRFIIEQWKSVRRMELDMNEKMLCYLELRQWIIRLSKNKYGKYRNYIFR